jgi:hypothetical protein
MEKVTKLMINWAELLPLLEVEVDQSGNIDHRNFISDLKAKATALAGGNESDVIFDAMYANRAILEVIFHFFDLNGENCPSPIVIKRIPLKVVFKMCPKGDGVISKEEFRKGCAVLNEKHPEQAIQDPDTLLKMMDIDGNDGIDINEFFEVKARQIILCLIKVPFVMFLWHSFLPYYRCFGWLMQWMAKSTVWAKVTLHSLKAFSRVFTAKPHNSL